MKITVKKKLDKPAIDYGALIEEEKEKALRKIAEAIVYGGEDVQREYGSRDKTLPEHE